MNHREHSLGKIVMLQEHPTKSEMYNLLAPAIVSIMQTKINIYLV